ncbi:MAG: cell division protein FtsZ [Candidatus Micrarchaeota archaeon]|nr:cell division protein FtsZ [Candidatus Micrarchaeota archaeon]
MSPELEKFEKLFGSRQIQVMAPQPVASGDDGELMAFLEQTKPRILVVGTGGSGSNTITRMSEIGVEGTTLLAMNTDAQHLLKTRAERKLLLGKKRTRGLGAGSVPQVGEEAAEESKEDLKKFLIGSDMVFVTCGLGGGTGTGSAHVIAEAAKAGGALVIAVVTMPFTSEGPQRAKNALDGLEKLKKNADTVIAIPNDRLLTYVPDLPLNAAFKAADMVLANAVKGIAELVTKPGLVNLDFADLRTILEKSGSAVIGLGEVEDGEPGKRFLDAAEKALSSPLIDCDLSEVKKALVNITGGPDLTLAEAEAVVQSISSRIHPDSHVIWGAAVEEGFENKSMVLTVLSGARERKSEDEELKEYLDLDFME